MPWRPLDTNVVAILPFRVTGPAAADAEWLREGMVDALSPSLDGFGGWRAVYPRRVLEAVARWSDSSDLAAGRLVARAVGAGRVVLGSALATRRELRLRADVYDPERGRVLWSAEARGAPSDPLPLIDSLAVELVRPRLTTQMSRGRSLVRELATTDPRALRAFLAAEPLARRGDVVARGARSGVPPEPRPAEGLQ